MWTLWLRAFFSFVYGTTAWRSIPSVMWDRSLTVAARGGAVHQIKKRSNDRGALRAMAHSLVHGGAQRPAPLRSRLVADAAGNQTGKRPNRPLGRGGFTMMETMAAMGVFAVGFVAVSSIFPVAALIQKQTVRDILSQQMGRNVQAMMEGRKFKHADLTSDPDITADLRVHGFLNPTDPPGGMGLGVPGPGGDARWKLNDRSYFFVRENMGYHPQHTVDLANPYAAGFSRSYYWVPLARRVQVPTAPADWQIFVFILRRDDAAYQRGADQFTGWANYDGFISPVWHVPGVHGIAVTVAGTNRFNFTNQWGTGLEINAGDPILDSNGVIHFVETADDFGVNVRGSIPKIPASPNKLWYGRPAGPGKSSPTVRIMVLSDAVE